VVKEAQILTCCLILIVSDHRIDKEDELQCLIKGCNFLLKNIPDEAFVYQRHGSPHYKFQITDTEAVFPYLLVNIGSGVSLIKVGSLCFDCDCENDLLK